MIKQHRGLNAKIMYWLYRFRLSKSRQEPLPEGASLRFFGVFSNKSLVEGFNDVVKSERDAGIIDRRVSECLMAVDTGNLGLQ